ncbi:TonB family protein [Mucilaginibacter sp. PAMB04274]|uniref:TonB family protein n=1 Tax=Mucilaginibacter sp. PAMB04274 TaxID=3138568 RepID=UPI0031F63C1D
MKYLLVGFLIMSCMAASAQRQNVYFFKNNGRQVTQRDSADYTRVVREPDSGSVLYKVLEYYLDGRPRRMALSSAIEPIKLEGACIEYYDNGKRKSVLNYSKGALAGEQFHYYRNGNLAETREYAAVDKSKALSEQVYLIMAFNDSSGKALVTNGNGRYKKIEGGTKPKVSEGELKKGLKDGEWKISVNRDSLLLTETYKEGKLVSGMAQLANGQSYTYTKSEALPQFEGGTPAFNKFLSKNLRYPSEAISKRIQGRVNVTFVVETDGTLNDVRAVGGSPNPLLAAEAIRVIKESPKWIPGVQYGRNVRVKYTVPIVFNLP